MIEYILLGIIQGITEWLPVSSSGHLVIFQQLFKIKADLFYDIWLHFGTLIVLILFFYKDILSISKKWILYIIIGSLITGVIGFSFYGILKSFFSNLMVVGLGLIFTGAILYLTKNFNGKRKMSKLDAILLGLAQGIAIIPGVSRSGMTISTGLFRNVDKEKVFKFSFLLSIPSIIGALIYEGSKVKFNIGIEHVVGLAVSIIVGYLSLRLLFNIVKKRKLHYFSYYCWIIGVIILLIQYI
jgi:undecaprenyl-diphosphatase